MNGLFTALVPGCLWIQADAHQGQRWNPAAGGLSCYLPLCTIPTVTILWKPRSTALNQIPQSPM